MDIYVTLDCGPKRCPEIPPGPELRVVLWSLARKRQLIDRKQVAQLPHNAPETSICVGLIRRTRMQQTLLCAYYVLDLP